MLIFIDCEMNNLMGVQVLSQPLGSFAHDGFPVSSLIREGLVVQLGTSSSSRKIQFNDNVDIAEFFGCLCNVNDVLGSKISSSLVLNQIPVCVVLDKSELEASKRLETRLLVVSVVNNYFNVSICLAILVVIVHSEFVARDRDDLFPGNFVAFCV